MKINKQKTHSAFAGIQNTVRQTVERTNIPQFSDWQGVGYSAVFCLVKTLNS
jgi:hypothetical protein